jgi:predicted acylesterase/phospholipase RssA
MRTFALTISIALLSGCASRGAMTFDCKLNGEMAYATVAPKSQLVRDIENDLPTANANTERAVLSRKGLPSGGGDPLNAALDQLFADNLVEFDNRPPKAILLLSGGGQWGAYGAGFLQWLGRERSTDKPNPLPHFQIVTGISTGALQAVFMGALDAPNGIPPDRLDAMAAGYAPKSEKDVVDRGQLFSAIFSGSVAGLKPLRARIENALCPLNSPKGHPCPAIEALADSETRTFVGFVDAQSGQFLISSINDIAKFAKKQVDPPLQSGHIPLRWQQARDCLTGVTMASAAVPVFYQQVKVDGKIDADDPKILPGPRTMYDGGVRHSVFEVVVAERLQTAEMHATGSAKNKTPRQPVLYVLRNGPTRAESEDNVQSNAGVLTAAQRGYSLLVNQSEVASIEALRLVRPSGPIFFTTADGFGKPNLKDVAPPPPTLPATDPWQRPALSLNKGCIKPTKGEMFDPEFMRCLQALGRSKANRTEPWHALSPITKDRK